MLMCLLVTPSFGYFNSGKTYSPHATSGSYVIDPDGDGSYPPFTVYCDVTDKKTEFASFSFKLLMLKFTKIDTKSLKLSFAMFEDTVKI